MLPGKKIAIPDFLQIARRRFWLLVVPPALALFVALLYSSTIPNVYESDMLIAIDPQRVPDSFVRSTVTLETARRMDALTVQVLSRTVLQQLIESFDLYTEERRVMPLEDVVAKMRENIKVPMEVPRPRWGQEPSPTAFHVRFTYPDPHIAARVTQEIGTLFVKQNTRDRGALAGATNRFLETQLADARKKLEEQERKLEAFREQHGKELPTQMTSNMQALTNAQLQAQGLVESIARDRDRKQMLERLYREALAEPPPVATAPAPGANPAAVMLATATQQLDAARASLAALKQRYKPDHPDVLRAERLVADLEPKAALEASAAPGTAANASSLPVQAAATPERRESLRQMRAEIESLDRQTAFKESEERRIRGEIAEYQRRIEAVPGLESAWVALTRDYDTQQQSYKELLSKSTAAQVAVSLEEQDIGETFRIVDPAVVPVHPVPSLRIRINAAGLALGLMLGVGIAALLELRDTSFRSDNDVLEVLALPVLAAVPQVSTSNERKRRRRRQWALSVAGATALALVGYVTWTFRLWNSIV
jgi:polysaccharide chain length determinant protein (PEP-CTERM system associated)